MAGNRAAAEQLDGAILRLDPQHERGPGPADQEGREAPGVKAAGPPPLRRRACLRPGSDAMQRGLDQAHYRLLRGVRWLALLCVALAAAGIDLFATEGETQRELPLPLGQRLWDLVPMAAIWVLGALLRYRRLRAGVRVNLQSLIRRRTWPRIVLAQAAWAMLCAAADHPGPLDATHGCRTCCSGQAGADGGDDVVRPEQDRLSPAPWGPRNSTTPWPVWPERCATCTGFRKAGLQAHPRASPSATGRRRQPRSRGWGVVGLSQ